MMKKHFDVIILFFVLPFYAKVSAITATSPKVTVDEGQKATLEWTVPSINTKGETLSSFTVRLESNGTLTIVSGDATDVTVNQKGKNEFGERLTATKVGDKLILFITKTEKSDQHVFSAVGLYDITGEKAQIELVVKSKGGGSSNIGPIVGGIVGGLLFVIILIVVCVCCIKKKKVTRLPQNEESSHPMSSYDTPPDKPPRTGEDANQYECYDAKKSQQQKLQPQDKVIYSELGSGGGRTGPKDVVKPSHYAEAKN